MTVTYFDKVHTASNFGSTFKVLLMKRGGILELVCRSLFLYVLAFCTISVLYTHCLIDYPYPKYLFEQFCLACSRGIGRIPIRFLLGFYVTSVVNRAWDMFNSIAWPDRFAMKLASYVSHSSSLQHSARHLRRTAVRYVNVAAIYTWRSLSMKAAKRFPTLDSMVKCNLLLPEEAAKLKAMEELTKMKHSLHWHPCLWAQLILKRMYEMGFFCDFLALKDLVNEVQNLNSFNGSLVNFANVNFPLPYVQVVTATTHLFLIGLMFARQNLDPDPDNFVALGWTVQDSSMYLAPIFTAIEFLTYMGWLKVAEVLLNPLGEDAEDFDICYFMDRNLQVSMLMVDGVRLDIPIPKYDPLPRNPIPDLPHTQESKSLEETTQLNVEDLKRESESSWSSRFGSMMSINSVGNNSDHGGSGRRFFRNRFGSASVSSDPLRVSVLKNSLNYHPADFRSLEDGSFDRDDGDFGDSRNLTQRSSTPPPTMASSTRVQHECETSTPEHTPTRSRKNRLNEPSHPINAIQPIRQAGFIPDDTETASLSTYRSANFSLPIPEEADEEADNRPRQNGSSSSSSDFGLHSFNDSLSDYFNVDESENLPKGDDDLIEGDDDVFEPPILTLKEQRMLQGEPYKKEKTK